MLETPHVAIGAAIAVKTGNPFLAIPLAFTSHFILERVPHWNPHLNTEKKKYGKITRKSTNIIIVDVLAALTLGGGIAFMQLPDIGLAITVLLASFASVLPDIVEGPYFFFDKRSPLMDKWIQFQKSIQSDTTVVPGLATQFATIVMAFIWILY